MQGRREELEHLVTCALAADGAALTGCLILGATGVGKTTLLEAGLGRLSGTMQTVVCRADELDQGVPFSLFIEISHRLRWSSPELRASADDLDAIFANRQQSELSDYMFEVSRWLRGLFRSTGLTGLVLACEDIHNVDRESLRLVSALIRTTPDVPLSIILTSRYGYEDRIGDVRRLLERSSSRGAGVVLELGPLDDDSVRAIAEAVMQQPLSTEVVQDIIEHSGGNPFLVTQCTPVLLDGNRTLTPTSPLTPSDTPPLPSSNSRLVLARFFPVEDERFQLAQAVSLFRGGVSIHNPALVPLAAAFGITDPESLATAWDALVFSGTLKRDRDNGDIYHLLHPLVGDALYDSIGPARRPHLHRMIASQLSSADSGGRRVFEIATHYLLACGGEPDEQAAVACLHAATVTEESASAVAALWLERSLDLLPAGDERRAVTTVRLIYAYLATGAARQAEEASAAAEREFSKGPRYSWMALPAAISYLTAGRPEKSKRLFQNLEIDGLNPKMRFWVASFRPLALLNCEEYEEARQAYDEAVAFERSAPAEPSVASSLAHATMAGYCAVMGRSEDYERHFHSCLEVLELAPRPNRREIMASMVYLDLIGPGRLSQVGDLLSDSYGRVLDDRELALLGSGSATAWTMIHWMRGDLSLTRKVARHVVSEMQASGGMLTSPGMMAVEVMMNVELGLLRRAREVGDQLESGSPGNHGYVAVARAKLLAADGRNADAREMLSDFLNHAYSLGVMTGVTLAAENLVGLLIEVGRVEEAQAVADEAYARTAPLNWPLQTMYALRARGIARSDIADVASALELCRTIGLGHEELVCELHLARLGESTRERLDRALAGFQATGAVASERLTLLEYRRHGLKAPRTGKRNAAATGDLTRSEQQVADLVVQGHSNRQVASRLHVSIKTVELHLTHIYAKKGVSSRTELAAQMLQNPDDE